MNEAFYVAAYEYYRRRGLVRGRYSLREVIGRQGYPHEVVELVSGFVDKLGVVLLEDYYDFREPDF